MTHQFEFSQPHDAVQLLAENGFEGMAHAMQLLINEAMKLQRQDYLGAGPYERAKSGDRMPMATSPKPSTAALGSLNCKCLRLAIVSSIRPPWSVANEANGR